MSTIEKIAVQPRTESGSTGSRRLRTQGIVPAVMYGHKKGAVSIQLTGEDVRALLKDGSKVVDLELDGTLEKTLLRDVQWDTFSKHILHVDFLRVDPDERIHVEIPVAFRGTAPGVLAGGIFEQPLHTIEVECLAVEIPDAIHVKIGNLQIGDSVHVSDLVDLPAGLKILNPADSVVVQISEDAKAVKEEEEVEDQPADSEASTEG